MKGTGRQCMLMLLGFLLASQAQPSNEGIRWSGKRLAEHFSGTPGVSSRNHIEVKHRLEAQAYLDAAIDAGTGRAWCLSERIKPSELDADIILELKQLPPAALRGNASTLVAELLSKRFPCPTTDPRSEK